MKQERIDVWGDTAARTYMVLGVAAALALGLALMQHSEGIWPAVPTLIAIAGLMFHWLSAPVFMLLSVAMALLVNQPQTTSYTPPMNDVLLAGSVVAVMLAHFRLYSITSAILPHDPRRTLDPSRQRRRGPAMWLEILMVLTMVPYIIYMMRRKRPRAKNVLPPVRRDGVPLVDEWPRAVGQAVVCGVVAIALWELTSRIPPPMLTIREQWRLGLMIWFVLTPVLLVSAVTWYRQSNRWSPAEARLVLNDELWRETRGEQRRIVRWISRARLNQNNRTEKLP